MTKLESTGLKQRINTQGDLASGIREFQYKYNIFIIKKKKQEDTEIEFYEVTPSFRDYIKK